MFSNESWWLIKQHKPNRKILVFYFALLTFQLWEVSHLCDPTWSTIVWGHPQGNILWKGHRLLHPWKINMDTKNDGLENVSPASNVASFWDDESPKKVTYPSCPVGDAAMPRLSNFTASTVPRASPSSFKEPPTLCGVMGLHRCYPARVNENIVGESRYSDPVLVVVIF